MNNKTFKEIRSKLDADATAELDDRGPSYASESDRLANFKAVGAELGITPLHVVMIYLKKHMRSIDRFVRDGRQTSEGVRTNFIGVRNYLDLAMALIEESEGRPDRRRGPEERRGCINSKLIPRFRRWRDHGRRESDMNEMERKLC